MMSENHVKNLVAAGEINEIEAKMLTVISRNICGRGRVVSDLIRFKSSFFYERSDADFAEIIGCSKSAISRNKKKLVEKGLISIAIEREMKDGLFFGLPTRYCISDERLFFEEV